MAALAEAMITLLKDRDLRIRMGRTGRAKIDTRFSAQTMVNQIKKVYEELLVKKADILQERKGKI